jgi:hypothetical protein
VSLGHDASWLHLVDADRFSIVQTLKQSRQNDSNGRSQDRIFESSDLVDQYTALVLAIFINAGLVEVSVKLQS